MSLLNVIICEFFYSCLRQLRRIKLGNSRAPYHIHRIITKATTVNDTVARSDYMRSTNLRRTMSDAGVFILGDYAADNIPRVRSSTAIHSHSRERRSF